MPAYPLTTIATLVALFVYAVLSFLVGKARTTYGIVAPAVTGNVEFEKRYRVQMNTIEQLALMLPVLWLCAGWVGDLYAALGGIVWSLGRIIYARGYYSAPEKRGPGFGLTFLPSVVMFIAVLGAVVRSML